MDHARAATGEPPQTREVEVERVEEASGRPGRDAIELERETATLELPGQRAEELVPPARRRRRELVEERQVGAAMPRRAQIELRSQSPTELA